MKKKSKNKTRKAAKTLLKIIIFGGIGVALTMGFWDLFFKAMDIQATHDKDQASEWQRQDEGVGKNG